jgi:hypothetical protein
MFYYNPLEVTPYKRLTAEELATVPTDNINLERRLTAAKRVGLWVTSIAFAAVGVVEAVAQQPAPVIGLAIGTAMALAREHSLARENYLRYDELEWRQRNPGEHPIPPIEQ